MDMLKNITLIQWIGIVILFNTTLLGGASQLGDLSLSPGVVKAILAVATLGNGFLGGLITMFGGQAAMVRSVAAMPGVDSIKVNGQANQTLAQIAVSGAPEAKNVEAIPAAEARVAATAKGAAVLLAIVLGGFLAFAGDAHAQVRKPQVTGDIVADTKANLGIQSAAAASAPSGSIDSAVSNFNSGIQKITKDLVDKAIADVTAAQTDAQNHNDQISKPCWDANLALLKSLPSQWETPPSPIGIALGIQIQRDLLNAITGNDATSLKVACAALWGDQLRIVGNLGALLGIRIATGGLL